LLILFPVHDGCPSTLGKLRYCGGKEEERLAGGRGETKMKKFQKKKFNLPSGKVKGGESEHRNVSTPATSLNRSP